MAMTGDMLGPALAAALDAAGGGTARLVTSVRPADGEVLFARHRNPWWPVLAAAFAAGARAGDTLTVTREPWPGGRVRVTAERGDAR